MNTSWDIALRWVRQNTFDDRQHWLLIEKMAWRHQATSHYCQRWPRSPFYEHFFHRNSNSIENSFCSHPSCRKVITMKFCTWHNSCDVVACVQFHSEMISCNGVAPKSNFHWISMEKSCVKWAPDLCCRMASLSHNELTAMLNFFY